MNDLMTKSFTSYVDLKKSAMKDMETVDLEAQKVEMTSSTAELSLFLAEAEVVKQEVSSLREILGRLQQANEESKTAHKSEALRLLRGRIKADMAAVLKKARAIRAQLEGMDRANAAHERGTPAHRSRAAVTGGLRQKLREVMMEFQGLRQRMMAEYRETVERRYFTVTGESPEEGVIERIVAAEEGGGGGEEVLARAVREHGRGSVAETVAEIQDRHGAAREVEATLLELHQVFMDMAVMVEAQGERVDDIEHHVMTASHYVADGTTQLKGARQYQRSSRKCMCLALLLLLVVLLVVVVPIATTLASS